MYFSNLVLSQKFASRCRLKRRTACLVALVGCLGFGSWVKLAFPSSSSAHNVEYAPTAIADMPLCQVDVSKVVLKHEVVER